MLGVVDYTDQFHYVQKLMWFLSAFLQGIEPDSNRMIQHFVVSRQMNWVQNRLHYLLLRRSKCMLISTRKLSRLESIHRELVNLVVSINFTLGLSTNYPLFAANISDPVLIRKASKAYMEANVHLRVFVLIQMNSLLNWMLKLIIEAESADICRGLFGWRELEMNQVRAANFTQNPPPPRADYQKKAAKDRKRLEKGSYIPVFLQYHLS